MSFQRQKTITFFDKEIKTSNPLDGMSRTLLDEFNSPARKLAALQQLLNKRDEADYQKLLRDNISELIKTFTEKHLRKVPPLHLPNKERQDCLDYVNYLHSIEKSNPAFAQLGLKTAYRSMVHIPVDAEGLKILFFICESKQFDAIEEIFVKLVEVKQENAAFFMLTKYKLSPSAIHAGYEQALKQGLPKLLRHLLQEFKLDATKLIDDEHPIFTAVKGSFSECTKILLQHGERANARDKDRMTPLMHAAHNNDLTTAMLLLSSNQADINAQDVIGETALQKALNSAAKNKFTINTNFTPMIRLLLQHNADTKLKDLKDNTVHDYVNSFEKEWQHGFAYFARLNLKHMLNSQIKQVAEAKTQFAEFDKVVSHVEKIRYKTNEEFIAAQLQALLNNYFLTSKDPILQLSRYKEKEKDFSYTNYFKKYPLKDITGVVLPRPKCQDKLDNRYIDLIDTALNGLEQLQHITMTKASIQERLERLEKLDWINYCPGLLNILAYARMSLISVQPLQEKELERFISLVAYC